jgi:hypothetical protein
MTCVLSASYVLHVTGPDAHSTYKYSSIIALQASHYTVTEITLLLLLVVCHVQKY